MKRKLKVKELTSTKEKLIGLIFKDKAEYIMLRTRFGIHTFLLKFKIDVVVLDNNFVVRKVVSGLNPNRILFWNPRYKIVLEMPAGTVKENNIQLGERLDVNIVD